MFSNTGDCYVRCGQAYQKDCNYFDYNLQTHACTMYSDILWCEEYYGYTDFPGQLLYISNITNYYVLQQSIHFTGIWKNTVYVSTS